MRIYRPVEKIRLFIIILLTIKYQKIDKIICKTNANKKKKLYFADIKKYFKKSEIIMLLSI